MTSKRHKRHQTYESVGDLSKQEANIYLTQLSYCDECEFDLCGRDSPSLELVQLAQKAGIKTQDGCPEDVKFVEYALEITPPFEAIATATHIANCNSCYTRLFDEGPAYREGKLVSILLSQ